MTQDPRRQLLRGLPRRPGLIATRCRAPSPRATARSTPRSTRRRFALASSDAFARACGLPRSPIEDIAAFHVVFGKTVPDVSLNAVANLGYAEGALPRCRSIPGDTLTADERGDRPARDLEPARAGVVWVRTTGCNQRGEAVLALLPLGDGAQARPRGAGAGAGGARRSRRRWRRRDLVVPAGLDFTGYDFALAGEPWRWGDYAVGERIDHVDRVTIEEAEHMLATRLWQNTAKVHFDVTAREDGRRLIYGGHVISLARALSASTASPTPRWSPAINAGAHANPCFAGDTVGAWSRGARQGRDRGARASARCGCARSRPRPGAAPSRSATRRASTCPSVLLDLDYWVLVPC